MILDVEVRPPWPLRLPRMRSEDGVMRVDRGVVTRLLHVDTDPVVVHAWQRRDGTVVLRAGPPASDPRTADPARASGEAGVVRGRGPAPSTLERAVERMRFALGIDDDYREFYDAFRADRLLGPAIRRRPWLRPRRQAWPWEALAWAVTKQLIESPRAAAIQRRIVARWGPAVDGLRDVPDAATVADVAPAELAAMDLAPSRAISLIKVARDTAAGHAELDRSETDRRLLTVPGIGTWTVRCLGLFGRGDPDALPSGDLGYVKLIGRMAGLGRRATPDEVEEFFAPYAPYRGLAGTFALATYHAQVKKGPPLIWRRTKRTGGRDVRHRLGRGCARRRGDPRPPAAHPAQRARTLELFLLWWLVVALGIGGILGAAVHVFDGPATAETSGSQR